MEKLKEHETMTGEKSKGFFLGEAEDRVVEPPTSLSKQSLVPTLQKYREMYESSLKEPEKFWGELAGNLHFNKPWTPGKFCEYNLDIRKGPVSIKWMQGAETNVCYNCVDRNVKNGLGDKIAFYWEGNDPEDSASITFKDLLEQVCKFANVLKNRGVKKGDRVAIYLPMILELPVVMLACARIGAIHSIIFGGFSAESLGARIVDAGAEVVITADGVWRGPKLIKLKEITDEALANCNSQGHSVRNCIVVQHVTLSPSSVKRSSSTEDMPGKRPCVSLKLDLNPGVDLWYHEEMSKVDGKCPAVWLDAEDPLFMLYTSGSTGKPKGVLHTQAGYLLYTYATFKYVFDYQPNDIYWCTADIGWITGHSYITYGPLSNGATGIIFEGIPTFPDPGRFWAVVDKYKVTKFYTAPTAIRALMKHGERFVRKHSRESLKILGTVGEPINPEAWIWYHEIVGDKRCSIVDTYWQTETGGHVMTPLPGATPMKPGSATFPFFGVDVAIMTEDGKEIEGPGDGYLVFKRPWPGLMRTVYKNHERFQKTYFEKFPGCYCTGDGCRRDDDGYYWITGRVDDMMNVSGHLLSTAEIESALVSHRAVAEAAVVAAPDQIKGQTPYCFVTLRNGFDFDDKLVIELKAAVRQKIGPVATPEYIQSAPGLPKTRSGKIMRRVLRKIAADDQDLGDLSTLADETVITELWTGKPTGLTG